MKDLVTGGAGYIGSHMVKLISLHGHFLTSLDDLSTGFRDAVLVGNFIEGSLPDEQLLNKVESSNEFDVVHFADSIAVGEFVVTPYKYYTNNLIASVNLGWYDDQK